MSIPQDPAGGAPLDAKRPGGEMRSAASAAPTRSQLLPFGTEWQELVHKSYFLPGVAGAGFLAAMCYFMLDKSQKITVHLGDLPVGVPMFTFVIAFLISVGGAFAMYRIAGKPKAWWLMPAVAIAAALLVTSPIMGMLQGVFDLGNSRDGGSFVMVFIKSLFGAGLPEECLKAIPVAIGAVIGAQLLAGRHTQGPLREFAVLDPLDGMILGAAAGFGFAFAETMFLYVPKEIAVNDFVLGALITKASAMGVTGKIPSDLTLFGRIMWVLNAMAGKIGAGHAILEFQRILDLRQSAGFELMIPRLIGNVFGHAAYAGVFGYFIGLAALKPQNRVKTVLTGLVIAASLHASWNSIVSYSMFGAFAVAALAFCCFAVCVMKARKISPDRSQLVASQIVADRFGGARPAQAMPQQPAPRPVSAPVQVPQATQAPIVVPQAAAVAAREMPRSVTWDDESNLRTIEIGSARVPATIGAKLYEGHVAGVLAGRGDGVIAEVTANPNDPSVLGLKNLSDRAWTFTSAGKAERELAPGRTIRLEAGMQIRIGQLQAHVR